MQRRDIAEWLGFQAVWLACALGAARGLSWPGICAALTFVAAAIHARGWRRADLVSVALSAIVGVVAETTLALTGIVRYSAPWPVATLAPAWIVALWLAFGMTLGSLRRLLGPGWPVKALLLGLLGSPLAYWSAGRLGALELIAGTSTSLVAIALIWAIAMPFLLLVRQRSGDEVRISLV